MPANPGAPETILLGSSLLALAAALAGFQLFERARRGRQEPDPASVALEVLNPEAEAAHLAARDRRRFRVAAVLGLIGLAMLASTRIDVQAGREAARLWAWTWLGVLVLALLLLVLGVLDWAAHRAHARRQGRALLEEQRILLAEVLRRREAERDGD